ncbi:MAG: hypothetical protein AMXMBFR36_23500 [Acidobacteriota bacterium]
MGRVYLAHDPNTDRRVALKIAAATDELDSAAAGQARERFLIEARAAGRLAHPGIVAVYDADVDAATGHPYLAMEWIDGPTLSRVVRERGPLPWRQAVAIAAEVADALDHAHSRGIVHRDVKPGNVMIDPAGRARIADFGIARIGDESRTLPGEVLGTPNYMSPEQLRGEKVDGRSDLFALGSVLYQALTGRPPFAAEHVGAVTHAVAHSEPDPPSTRVEGIPNAVDRVVARALAKDREHRFASGREMAHELRALLGEVDGGFTSDRLEPSVTVVGSARERRRVAVAVAILALAALGALAIAFGRSRPSEGPASTAPRVAASSAPTGSGVPDSRGASETTPATPAPVAGEATLELTFFNRLRGGTIAVWVDGERVWSRELELAGTSLKRVTGQAIRAEIPVAAGEHDIEVRVTGNERRVDAQGVVRASFTPGATRNLRVTLVPFRSRLDLDWN